jgi:hypothetical protein
MEFFLFFWGLMKMWFLIWFLFVLFCATYLTRLRLTLLVIVFTLCGVATSPLVSHIFTIVWLHVFLNLTTLWLISVNLLLHCCLLMSEWCWRYIYACIILIYLIFWHHDSNVCYCAFFRHWENWKNALRLFILLTLGCFCKKSSRFYAILFSPDLIHRFDGSTCTLLNLITTTCTLLNLTLSFLFSLPRMLKTNVVKSFWKFSIDFPIQMC